MAPPLSAIRILDLSRVLAGPWASQMLADLGAEVIKIEKPGQGDDTRGWGPPFITNKDGSQGDAAYFLSANRGKASVAIDLASEQGQRLIRELACLSDVFIENFKLNGLKKYGLDYESLKKLNPKLIYCSITGFGQDGPYAARAGYDFMIQGMSGIMSLTGEPQGQPMKVGVAFADIFTGLHAVIAIVSALYARTQSGEGQFIDLALLDSQVAVLANQALNYLVSGQTPQRLGNAHPNIVPYQTFATADGHIIMAVGNDRQFSDFCEIIGLGGLKDDPRFATNQGRVENREVLTALLTPALKKRGMAEWLKAFEAAHVPCGPINQLDQVFADPQVKARGLEISLTRPDGTVTPGVANPIRFAQTPVHYDKAAPELGADTAQVLSSLLGLSAAELLELRAKGVIGGKV